MIEFENVTKTFDSKTGPVNALDDVSFSVATGDYVAVRGHSGCGKSTLLSIAGALTSPTSGQVRIAGQEIGQLGAAERTKFRKQHIGFVFQLFHLLPYLSVVDNVLVAADDAKSAETKDRASELLATFDLEDRLTHRPGQLSVGERQRVALARALLNKPKLLLADEPTGNLDPRNADIVLGILSSFHTDGGTILLVTHDENAAAQANSKIELDHGKLVTEQVA